MGTATRLYCSFLLLAVVIICDAYPGIPALEQEFKVEGYQKDGDTQTIVLKLVPTNPIEPQQPVLNRKPRQEEEEAGDDDVSSTTPFIPAIIPGLTKIFTGLLTGNLNDIIHGSSSFAPQNVSHTIDSVYNQVVGLPAPVSTPPTSRRPLVAETEEPAPAPVTEAPASQASVAQPIAGSPLASTQGSVTFDVTEAATTPTSNEDDEDESEGLGVEFGRSVLKRNGSGRI